LEFLAKHFEKLILVVCLLCILLGIYVVINGVRAGQEKIKQQYESAVEEVEGDKVLPDLDVTKLMAVQDSVKDRRVNLAINPPEIDDKKGALLYPKRYILCKRPSCGYVVSIKEEQCPFCSMRFDPFKETTIEDDTDKDGIPDLVEQRTYFLNYLDPFDARFDEDGDGFLNIEEYQLKTKMDNPESSPDLVHLLRIQDVRNIQLPFIFLSVKTLDSDKIDDWKVDFDFGRGRRQQVKINEEISRTGCTVSAISSDRSTVSVKNKDATIYQMKEKQIVSEEIATVSMRYLLTRNRNEASDRRLFVPLFLKIGSDLTLKKQKGEEIVEEYYRILRGTNKDDVVIGKLDAAKGNVVVEYIVLPLDIRKDFIAEPEGRTGPRMRTGEESGSPGRRPPARR